MRPKGSQNKTCHTWTKEQKEYLKKICFGRHYREIQEEMNKKFNLELTLSQIKGAINRYGLNTGFDGRFKKGQKPWNAGTKGLMKPNKTSFKKGQKSLNWKPVGSERITKDGYIEIKIAEPNKWRLKHRVVWEEHNGKVPKGYTIIFGDKNRQNIDINNLLIISRSELLQMNKRKLFSEDIEITRTGTLIAKLIIKTNERNISKK